LSSKKFIDFFSVDVTWRSLEDIGVVLVAVEDDPELRGQNFEDEVGVGFAVLLVDGLEGSSVENGLKLAHDFRFHFEKVTRVDGQTFIRSLKEINIFVK
jgi:hypothetical protein